jgi:pimeloyl-ACP methyl ester carboxylesterase
VRAALLGDEASRLTPDELKEVLIQSAIYAGVPAANTAFTHAQAILREVGPQIGYELASLAPAASSHPGIGREGRSNGRPALHYAVREPRNGKAPRHTVVLSHAIGCDLTMWDDLANQLAQDCRVIAYDHRGHGSSEAPAGAYSMADLADDAAALLRELDTGPVVWVGLSMGGMVGPGTGAAPSGAGARAGAGEYHLWLSGSGARGLATAHRHGADTASKPSPTPSWGATSTTVSAPRRRPAWRASAAAWSAPMWWATSAAATRWATVDTTARLGADQGANAGDRRGTGSGHALVHVADPATRHTERLADRAVRRIAPERDRTASGIRGGGYRIHRRPVIKTRYRVIHALSRDRDLTTVGCGGVSAPECC